MATDTDGESLERAVENEERHHKTGFTAWKKRSECSSFGEWLKSGYAALTQDGVGAGLVNHGLNIAGIVAALECVRYVPPLLDAVLSQYLPVAQALSGVSVGALPLGLETVVEGALAALAAPAAGIVYGAIAGAAGLAAGYLAFRFFDWLGDDSKFNRLCHWTYDRTVKPLWDCTGGRAIGYAKERISLAGQSIREGLHTTKARLTNVSPGDRQLSSDFAETIQSKPAPYA